MRRLRAGLVGLGVMGRNHARVLASLDGVDFVGVVDPLYAGSGIGPTPVMHALQDLIDLQIDYCVVATPTETHLSIGMDLAVAGVSALIEKPLAMTFDEAIQLDAAFRAARLVGGVGHIERFNGAIVEARRRILDGQLGRIYQVATRRQGPFPQRVQDVGVSMDLATHDIDIASWITGKHYTRVAAQTVKRSANQQEDMVSAVGQLEEGIITSHLVNWMSPFKERTVVVTGESGTFVADTLGVELTHFANGVAAENWDELALFRGVQVGEVTRYATPRPEPLRAEHESFRDAVWGIGGRFVTMTEGSNIVRVAEALVASAQHDEFILFKQ